ncbi:MAG: hypothetical protein U0871_16385 [Gemmataceae bacterium]
MRWPLGVYVEDPRHAAAAPTVFHLLHAAVVRRLARPGGGRVVHLFACGVLGMALNYSAYEARTTGPGCWLFLKGQMEAVLALGMTRGTAVRRVVVLQAVRLVILPVTNDFIAVQGHVRLLGDHDHRADPKV